MRREDLRKEVQVTNPLDGTLPTVTGFLPVSDPEVLSVLLPDVDWEALREARGVIGEGEWRDAIDAVLAVHDGKDGE